MTCRSPKNLHRSPPSFQLNTNLSTYRVKPHKTGEVQIPGNSNYWRETCREENGLWTDWATELSKARVGSDWGSDSRSVVSDSATPWTIHSPWDSPGKNTGVGCHFLLQWMKVKVKSLSRVRPSATPWTAAHQAPPSMGFSRQEYWSGVPLPSPNEDALLLKDTEL